jgi:ParB family chromosome partitioning protein
MVAAGVKRGAPKGLLTVRLVFDPRRKSDRKIWERLNEKASHNGLDVTDYVRNIVAKHVQ